MIGRLWRSTFGLVVLVTVGFALASLGIGAIAVTVTHEALEQQLDHRIEIETSALLAEAHEGMPDLIQAIRRREAARSTASLDYLLVDAQNRPIAGAMTALVPVQPGYDEFFHYRVGNRIGVAQALTTVVPGGRLVVAADREGLIEIDSLLGALFAGALAAMLLLGTGAAALVGWLTRRRLARIDGTALAVIGGDLGRRIPRDGSGSEFDNLAGTLNRMLERISGLMDNLRQVSSDVAHDLRTPLTRLCSRLDRALAQDDAEARVREVEAARAEAAELLEIFAALLRIAEIEGMAERLPRLDVDLSLLVEQMAETYRPDAEASGHHLHCVAAPHIHVSGDRRLLSQAIANLLDNGLRHTPSGTTITLSLEQSDEIILIVSDDGPGVDVVDRDRLFQRFARAERARSSPGQGLGLALVKAVTMAHGGSVGADDAAGFSIRMTFPGPT